MPLKTLIVVALRLYTLYWLVEGVTGLLIAAPFLFSMSKEIQMPIYQYLFPPLGMLLIAVVLWLSASGLSAKVTRGHDTELAFTALTRRDLYRFAFVFLGLFFALSSIHSVVVAGQNFFTFDLTQPDGNPDKGRYLWPLLGHAFTLMAGLVCFFGADRWTTKLMRLENKSESIQSPV